MEELKTEDEKLKIEERARLRKFEKETMGAALQMIRYSPMQVVDTWRKLDVKVTSRTATAQEIFMYLSVLEIMQTGPPQELIAATTRAQLRYVGDVIGGSWTEDGLIAEFDARKDEPPDEETIEATYQEFLDSFQSDRA